MRCCQRLLILFAALPLLAGATCSRNVRPVPFDAMPVPVLVPQLDYITVPSYLTEPLPIAMPGNRSCGEAVRVARERRVMLERANADRAETRKLGGDP